MPWWAILLLALSGIWFALRLWAGHAQRRDRVAARRLGSYLRSSGAIPEVLPAGIGPGPLRCPAINCPHVLSWTSYDPARASIFGMPVDAVGVCPVHGQYDVLIIPPTRSATT